MCGLSKRFTDEDYYTVPRFLLDVDGMPMYVAAVLALKMTIPHQLYFIVDAHASTAFNLNDDINSHFPSAVVIEVVGPTRGQAETVLLSAPSVDINNPSLIISCDSIFDYDAVNYMSVLESGTITGSLLTFEQSLADPQRTYVDYGLDNAISHVAANIPFSNTPIVGTYHWANSIEMYKDLVDMITREDSVDGEYQVCPAVEHSASKLNSTWIAYQVRDMMPLRTPKDYELYTLGS